MKTYNKTKKLCERCGGYPCYGEDTKIKFYENLGFWLCHHCVPSVRREIKEFKEIIKENKKENKRSFNKEFKINNLYENIC